MFNSDAVFLNAGFVRDRRGHIPSFKSYGKQISLFA